MLKLAFSTLGCPGWEFDDIISTAKDLGYDAVEIRGIGREMHAPDARVFSAANIDSTKQQLARLGLEICCLTSFARLNETYRIEAHMNDARAYIDLAAALDTPYVRVIGDSGPVPTDVPFEQVVRRVKELADYASGTGVSILVENNGAFADSKMMLKLLDAAARDNVAVLWDINHPCRNYGESAAYTFEVLGKHIKYMHIKDSVVGDDGIVKYEMIGRGDLPIREAVELLRASGVDGYLSLEWLKRWCMSLAEPGIAFPHYVNYMKNLLK